MGDEERGEADFCHYILVPAVDVPFRDHIQSGERLVEESDALRIEIGAKQRGALPHPAGQLDGVLVFRSLKPELREIALCFLPGFRFFLPFQEQRERDIVDDLLVGQQQVFLEHVTDSPRLCGYVFPGEQDAPAVRGSEAGENLEQGRFAGSAEPEERDQFPLLKMDGDVADDRPLPIGFCDVFRFQ